MSFKAKVIDLDCLRVVLVKDERQSVTVEALVGSGSREETNREAGAAHFLEHFVFKGTRKFPGRFEVMETIDKVGGMGNAYTSSSKMGFWVKTDKEKMDLGVKVVGQLVSEPLLPEKYFDQERGTIMEELYMYEDRPESKVSIEKWKLLFGKTNLGRMVIGTVKSLKEMKPAYLRKYMETWLVPENMLLGVVGNFGEEKKLLALIEREFESLFKRKKKLPVRDAFAWGKQAKPRKVLIERKVDQAHVSMGFPGLALTDKSRWPLYLVNIILGGGTISRLFREVREKRGWAYSVGSGAESFPDAGAFLVGAGLPKGKLKEAVELILEIMWGLGGRGKWGITDKELAMAKDCYKGRISLKFDKPENVLGYALNDLMFEGKIYTPKEIRARIDRVSLEEMREVCKRVFKPEKLNLAVVGDYQGLPFKF